MSEKKMVGRSVTIALGIVCIILIAGLGGAMAFYTKAINDKSVQYDSYVASHSRTNAEYNSYVASHSHSDSEYDALVSQNSSLQSQVNSLQAPDVLKVDLKGDNFFLRWQTSHLHVYGYLFNAGTLPATDVRLRVVLYSLEWVLNDTYVDVGPMGGRTWASVDANVTYDGMFGSNETLILTRWTITPEWTAL